MLQNLPQFITLLPSFFFSSLSIVMSGVNEVEEEFDRPSVFCFALILPGQLQNFPVRQGRTGDILLTKAFASLEQHPRTCAHAGLGESQLSLKDRPPPPTRSLLSRVPRPTPETLSSWRRPFWKTFITSKSFTAGYGGELWNCAAGKCFNVFPPRTGVGHVLQLTLYFAARSASRRRSARLGGHALRAASMNFREKRRSAERCSCPTCAIWFL